MTERLLIALDIDGTILDVDGAIPGPTRQQINRLRAAGHEVLLATGRAAADKPPVRGRPGAGTRRPRPGHGAPGHGGRAGGSSRRGVGAPRGKLAGRAHSTGAVAAAGMVSRIRRPPS